MTVWYIAFDIIREAIARKYMLALFICIVGVFGLLTFSLDLEVVDGAIAASRLFGSESSGLNIPVQEAFGPIFAGLVLVVFYFGLLFGIIATADIAPKMLAPGRVEFLLSFPVRRVELVIGTYLGVMLISFLTTTFAIGGVSLILFWKAQFVTAAPAVGAAVAVLGFMSIYAAMLLTATWVRSAALSAGAGMLLYFAGILASYRADFLGWISSPLTRTVLDGVLAPLPKLGSLADIGRAAATGGSMTELGVPVVVGGVLLFAAAAVTAACFVVTGKDY
jgi:ABC-type transport system involved in multi-copper enzyme maturation permease subunit